MPRPTPATQAAAIELGFATGSMLAQVALPPPLRQRSFAGFARSEADLRTFLRQLGIAESDASSALASIKQGFGDPNSLKGAERLLDGMNQLKVYLATGSQPALMHAFRIGFVVGHTLEFAAVYGQGNPTPQHLQAFVAVTGRYRTSLPEDLASADLPTDLVTTVRRTDVEVQTVADLKALTSACQAVKDRVERMKA